MKQIALLPFPIKGYYRLDEFTTEYGNIILDGSETGGISDSFIFEVRNRSSFINHYLCKKTGTLKSIRLILIADFNIVYDPDIYFEALPPFFTPKFDITPWGFLIDKDEYSFSNPVWPIVSKDEVVTITHNGINTVQLVYGDINKEIMGNENISFLFDDNQNMHGVKIFSEKYVPELITKIKAILPQAQPKAENR
jgi:hypothetical protein